MYDLRYIFHVFNIDACNRNRVGSYLVIFMFLFFIKASIKKIFFSIFLLKGLLFLIGNELNGFGADRSLLTRLLKKIWIKKT